DARAATPPASDNDTSIATTAYVQAQWATALTFTAGLTVSGGAITCNRTGQTQSAALIANGDNGQYRSFNVHTAGVMRWRLGANTISETGSGNTGSNYFLQAFDDAGASLGNCIVVTRATRVCDFAVSP